jgi:protocatechuate 3,4-dioxygenase beta subunit
MRVLTSLILFPVWMFAQGGPPPTPEPPPGIGSESTIADSKEPGPRLVIFGQVFGPDGVSPAPGVIVYAYHTDATGEYHNDRNRVARLHGWAKTDSEGHFVFRTIRPAPYPGNSIPAHVHFHAWGGGYPLQWTKELKFDDDPLIKERDRASSKALGEFANIRTAERDAGGTQKCTIRFRLRKETNYPAQYRDDPRIRP